MEKEDIKKVVRREYGSIARQAGSSCGCGSGCCGGGAEVGRSIGYSDQELASVPAGANLGLGCGNPLALASIREGETVLDLGSGAGFDCFLAAQRTGRTGRVIGVDMTPEMVERARENAARHGIENVEFIPGEIDALPVEDASVDLVISNCVINLAHDKEQVFREAFRVLKPGGRLMVSDIVVTAGLPAALRDSVAGYVGCVSGAVEKDKYLEGMRKAGFADITVHDERVFPIDCMAEDPAIRAILADPGRLGWKLEEVAESVRSISVSAIRPA
ncbi:MAG: arsenite methyltransferase [Methanomicrobiaceae archaeon]|uniref:Arsenite methyltransferase n=1 Tax=hydrocarbon metagenome TaxID=938273 RepID=A0A0W8FK02_9ZZZZ|nr:arsenite methyltransferase [Methanomicrobiaceae archaeon]MDD5418219.1 arsenite methyltransferase [Methanomicrobiaceae archaeon]